MGVQMMFVQIVLLNCRQFSGTLYRTRFNQNLTGKPNVNWAALSRLGQMYF